MNEGPCYSLGKVEVIGEDLPVASMLRAARLPEQKPANWKQVMAGIGEMERILKTDGYLAVASRPEKSWTFKIAGGDLRFYRSAVGSSCLILYILRSVLHSCSETRGGNRERGAFG